MNDKNEAPMRGQGAGAKDVESGAPSPTKIAMIAEQFNVTTQTQESHYNMLTQKLESRIEKYLAKMPESVSGQFGHDKLFDAAKAVVRGFAVEPAEAAELLKKYFNPRCRKFNDVKRSWEPYPWSDDELEHKCNEALNNSTDDRARGYLLSAAERAKLKALPSEPRAAENTAAKVTAPPPPQPVDHGPLVETVTYLYDSADGKRHHQVQRRKYADGTKDFYSSHWDGQTMKPGAGHLPRVPYNAAELVMATHIWFVEGEKCAESLKAYLKKAGKLTAGVGVTCVMGGVNGWKPELAEHFRDKHVCMIPDHDEAGYKFAKKIGENLDGVAASFQVRKWVPETPAKWDIADVMEQHLMTGNGVIPDTPPDAGIFETVFPTEQLEPPQPIDCLAEVLPATSDAESPTDTTPPAAEAECLLKPAPNWRSQGHGVTSQSIADAYIQHILKPENRNLCYTPDDKWWDYSPEDGWGVIDKKAVEAEVKRFVRRHMKAIHDFTDLPTHRLNSILSHIQHSLTVMKSIGKMRQAGLDPSLFLNFGEEGVNVQSGAGWLSCHSHLLNVIPLAEYLAAKNRGQAPERSLESLGFVRPADSSLFTKGKIPCAFDPTATCPRWMQFLEEACPEDAKQLQMMFGLTFSYINWLPAFFVIYGPAGTGKTRMAEMLEILHSGATCNISLGVFGEKFEETPLTEDRLNIFSDMESIFEGGAASKREAVLKLIAGKESKNVQDKNVKTMKKNLIAWCVFCTNIFPRFLEQSAAISDRMRLIRFPNAFRGTDKQDPYLQQKLMAELSGILNWALIGLGELLLDGHRTFPESESAKAEKLEYIKSANPILVFCDEHLDKCGDSWATGTLEIMEKYNEFCKTNNYKPAGSSKVIPAIREHFGLEQQNRPGGGNKKGPSRLYGIQFQSSYENPNRPRQDSDIHDRL